MEEGRFLGFMITPRGIKANPKKIQAIENMQSPKSKKDVQSLNGKLAALTRFLSRAADRALPFFQTLKGCLSKKDFIWTDEAERAFQDTKAFLKELPVLPASIPGETLTVYLAASTEAIISVLIADRGKTQMPVYFLSKKNRHKDIGDGYLVAVVFKGDSNRNIIDRAVAVFFGLLVVKFFEYCNIKDETWWWLEWRGGGDDSNKKKVQFWLMFELQTEDKCCNRKDDTWWWLECRGGGGDSNKKKVQFWLMFELQTEDKCDRHSPFPRGVGNVKFLVVAIDYFTKWVKAKPLSTITGRKILTFVWEDIVCRFGLPREIVSDNGTQFAHNPFKDWCADMDIQQSFTSVAYPQANGQVEVTNRDIVAGIKARLGKHRQGWVDELQHVLWAHRTTPKDSMNETPFSLVYGTEAVIPAEVLVPTDRIMEFDEQQNDDALSENLDALEER
ncbi:uncharacterized protein [Rutidosis leptorrhynchoides]|uniref:uncharacterized protein n=1 Tax=Rutidosis leptorrhynchoides TaxID=125765 RepID=UPI003A998550